MVWPLRSCIVSLLVLNLLSSAPAAAAAEPPLLTCSAEGAALTLWATPARGGGLAALTAKIPGQAEVSLRGGDLSAWPRSARRPRARDIGL